jgi:hypothetical protein
MDYLILQKETFLNNEDKRNDKSKINLPSAVLVKASSE